MADKPRDRKQLLFRNSVYSLISWLLPISLALIVTPIIVRRMGNEAYGLYVVILGFISYSFSLGIGKTAAKYVSEYRASGETEKISETISSIVWISLLFGLVVIAIMSMSADYIVVNILQISADFRSTAVVALYFASFTILITMISQIFQFILQGIQRFDRYLLLTNLSGLLLNLGSVLLVIKGYGVLALVAWNAVVISIVGFLFYLSARRLLPEFKMRIKIKSDVWGTAIRYALSIVVYQSIGNILILFERAWIVRKFGTEALTFYVVPMALCFYFHGIIGSLSVVLFPAVNELLLDKERLTRLYRTASKVIVTMTAFFVVTIFFEGKIFLDVWMKGDFAAASYSILVIHSLTFAVLAITNVAWQTTESFGFARLNAIVTVLWLVISVPLMLLLAVQWQSTGIAFARFVGVLAYLPLIVFVEHRFLGGIFFGYWWRTLIRLVSATIAAGGIELLILSGLAPGWTSLTLAGLAGAVTFTSALLVLGYLDGDEKAVLYGLILRVRQT